MTHVTHCKTHTYTVSPAHHTTIHSYIVHCEIHTHVIHCKIHTVTIHVMIQDMIHTHHPSHSSVTSPPGRVKVVCLLGTNCQWYLNRSWGLTLSFSYSPVSKRRNVIHGRELKGNDVWTVTYFEVFLFEDFPLLHYTNPLSVKSSVSFLPSSGQPSFFFSFPQVPEVR